LIPKAPISTKAMGTAVYLSPSRNEKKPPRYSRSSSKNVVEIAVDNNPNKIYQSTDSRTNTNKD
jgi:hypothetical protein